MSGRETRYKAQGTRKKQDNTIGNKQLAKRSEKSIVL
jgi:hypothetical protein